MRNALASARRLSVAALLVAAGACARAPSGCGDSCAVILTRADPDVLLPGVTQSADGISIALLMFLNLADPGPGMNTIGDTGFVPRLARAWHFEDSLTIAFQLDPRARWQDGQPVRAADVVFSFDLYRDSLFGSPVRSLLSRVASVTARNSLTAVVKFRTWYPEEFYDASYQVTVLPKHLLDTIPPDRIGTHPFARHPIGDGPYRFVSWQAGQSVELRADTSFFLGRPGIDRLIWRVAPDPVTQVTQIESGDADIIPVMPDPALLERARHAKGVQTVPYAGAAYLYIGFNLRDPAAPSRPHPLLGDRALRRAIMPGVDRPGVMATVLTGLGSVPNGPWSQIEWTYERRPPEPAYDTAAADAALDRLGWKARGADGIRTNGGRRLAFTLIVPGSPLRRRAGELVQDQLRRIGVDMQIQPLDANTFLDRARTGHFDALFGSWSTDPTPSSALQTWTTSGIAGGFNFQHYSNPAFDRLAARAVEAPTRARAQALWREATDTLNADAVSLWMIAPSNVAILSARVQDATIQPNQWAANIWRWHIARP